MWGEAGTEDKRRAKKRNENAATEKGATPLIVTVVAFVVLSFLVSLCFICFIFVREATKWPSPPEIQLWGNVGGLEPTGA